MMEGNQNISAWEKYSLQVNAINKICCLQNVDNFVQALMCKSLEIHILISPTLTRYLHTYWYQFDPVM